MFETRFTFVHESRKYHGREGWLLGPVTREGAHRVQHAGQFYRVKTNAVESRKFSDVADALPRLRDSLEEERYGTDVRLRAFDLQTGEFVDAVKFVKTRTKVPDPADPEFVYGAGPVIDDVAKWGGHLQEEYAGNGTFRFAGMTVCKQDSDHAHGAACDNFDTWSNMDRQNRDAFQGHEDGRWRIKYTILRDDLMKPDGHGGFYRAGSGSTYHAHLHVSFVGGLEWGCPYQHDTPWS